MHTSKGISPWKTFALNLRKELNARGIEQKKMALDLDHTQASISYWCSGKKLPAMQTVIDIADYLHIPVYQLFMPDGCVQEPSVYKMRVPVSADGSGISYVDEYQTSEGDMPSADFAMIAPDDSMSPSIQNGDLVLCKKTGKLSDGDCAVITDGAANVIRCYKPHREGCVFFAFDTSCPLVVCTQKSLPPILGKVILIQRIVKRR